MTDKQRLDPRLAGYRRGACLPACGCSPADLVIIRIDRQEWQRARTRYRLRCGVCGRWGRKFVPERFLTTRHEEAP